MASAGAEVPLSPKLRFRLLSELVLSAAVCCTVALTVAAQQLPISSGRVVSGTLSFDGHATAGDFTGTTNTVTGMVSGGPDLGSVRGWVEAPVRSLKTGNGRRDRDLNKSMESDKYPTLRFELQQVIRRSGPDDSIPVVFQGQLRIHGVSRRVELPGTLQFTGTEVRVRSNFPLNLKDYRIGGLSKLLGMLRMYEDIEVHADLVFRLDSSAASQAQWPGSIPASGPAGY
ncbi:MAG TPA: YceI family protein [Gemmatimonadales bacterium]|nr:YceI family protein [Gemmatimonadales bacterium]